MRQNATIDMGEVSNEFHLMLQLLVKGKSDSDFVKSEKFLREINWEGFIKLVCFHRVYPIIHQNLSTIESDFIPDCVKEQLNKLYVINTMQMLKLTGEMERVCKKMNHNQVQFLMLKGPVLSYQLYGDLASRTSNDLDLLISFDDLEKVTELLLSLGYEIAYDPPRILKDWQIRNHHIEFFNKESNCEIEVHWRLHPGPSKEPCFQELWEDRKMSNITKTPISCLGEKHLFYYLVTHGARHGWFRLRWLTDIVQMMNMNSSFEEQRSILRANDSQHLYDQAIYLSSTLLHLPTIESGSLSNLNRRGFRLAEEAFDFIKEGIDVDHPPSKVWKERSRRYLFQIKPSSQKCSFLIRKFFPNSWDAEFLPLPKPLHFLYFPLRPFIWVWKNITKKNVSIRRS